MQSFTVKQLLSDEKLRGLKLVAGFERQDNLITGTNIIDNPDTYDWLTAGEFVLTTGYLFQHDSSMQIQLIRELFEINCAGLGIKVKRYLKEVPKCMTEEAERLGLPIVEIPFQHALAKVSNHIGSEIAKRDRTNLKNYLQIHDTITQCMLQNGDLEHLARLVCMLIQNPLIIVDCSWNLLVCAEHPDNPIPIADHLNLKKGAPVFSAEFLSKIPDNIQQYTKSIKRKYPGTNVLCRILSVSANDVFYGFLIIWESIHKMTALDYIALEMTATSVALERVKAKQIQEIKHNLRHDFFDDLLEGKIESINAINNLSEIHHLDSRQTYICVVTKINTPNDLSKDTMAIWENYLYHKKKMIATIEAIAYKMLRKVVSIHRGNLIISFVRVEEDEILDINSDTRELLETVYQELRSQYERIEIGVGNPCSNFLWMRNSYLNALEAINIAARIKKEFSISFYADMRVYQLLDSIQPRQKLQEFVQHVLGKLQQHDEENDKAKLVTTLEEYFFNGGNITLAAKKMYLHRNSFIYRLEKIKDILGIDFKQPDALLELQIALKAAKILRSKTIRAI